MQYNWMRVETKIKGRDENKNVTTFTNLGVMAILPEFLQISRISQENY